MSSDLKIFRHMSDTPWINVLNVLTVTKKRGPYSFPATDISHLEGLEGNRSAIVLKDKTTFILSLSKAELIEKIDSGYSPVDLEQYCETSEPAADTTVGVQAADGSVYLGQYEPRDREGRSLGKIFNVFAAPQDLISETDDKKVFKYVEARKRVEELQNWYGHNGADYATDKDLYKALDNGSYKGEWIIPTRDLLCGEDIDAKRTQPDNLYARRGKGALKGTFATVGANGNDYPSYYWSSTEARNYTAKFWSCSFSSGNNNISEQDSRRQSCRLVRLVPV